MKVIKNVTLFFAVILMFSAFFINIIIANAVEKPDYLVLDELEYITFDEKYVGDDVLLYFWVPRIQALILKRSAVLIPCINFTDSAGS